MKKYHYLKPLLLLGLSWCFVCPAAAQKEYLSLYSRNEVQNQSWQLGQVRKLTFSPTGVEVYLKDEWSPYSVPYGNVWKLTFEDTALSTQVDETTVSGLSLRYDAARSTFLLGGLTEKGVLQVYSINGTLAWSEQVPVGTSAYPAPLLLSGVYIVRLSSGSDRQSIKLFIP